MTTKELEKKVKYRWKGYGTYLISTIVDGEYNEMYTTRDLYV